MKVNETVKLFLKDVYLYDIEACHYTILQKIGYNMEGIDREDKLKRNIQIGMLMRKNPQLTNLLRSTTKSIIDEYIEVNFIKDEEIILRQYDGIIITRPLKITNTGQIRLDARKHFEIFIISFDRTMYIALDSSKEISIKGMAYRYEAMDKILGKICKIRYSSKVEIFSKLQAIKNDILTSTNPELFAIPVNEESCHIFFKEYGGLEIKKSLLYVLDTEDIDREKYFKFYLEPFTKTIALENL
jgi:hypothetical protein